MIACFELKEQKSGTICSSCKNNIVEYEKYWKTFPTKADSRGNIGIHSSKKLKIQTGKDLHSIGIKTIKADLLVYMLSFLDSSSIRSASMVNKRFNKCCDDQLLWLHLCINKFNLEFTDVKELETINTHWKIFYKLMSQHQKASQVCINGLNIALKEVHI